MTREAAEAKASLKTAAHELWEARESLKLLAHDYAGLYAKIAALETEKGGR